MEPATNRGHFLRDLGAQERSQQWESSERDAPTLAGGWGLQGLLQQHPKALSCPVGTRFSPNTLHCLTGQCWVRGVSAAEPIWLSSPPKTACWQKQPRQPTAPAAHMHGLIGTSEPRAPAHAADAPCP